MKRKKSAYTKEYFKFQVLNPISVFNVFAVKGDASQWRVSVVEKRRFQRTRPLNVAPVLAPFSYLRVVLAGL